MSKADKMFEELGFEKIDYSNGVGFNNSVFGANIDFTRRMVSVEEVDYINVKIHLAIHEKMKELGWI